jgi:hypothetical protein
VGGDSIRHGKVGLMHANINPAYRLSEVSLTHAATMVYPGEMFDPLAVLEAIKAERCAVLYGPPRCSSPSSLSRNSPDS